MGKCLRHKEEGSIRIRLGSLRRGRSKEGFAGPLVPSGASGDTLLGKGVTKDRIWDLPQSEKGSRVGRKVLSRGQSGLVSGRKSL